MSAPGRSSSGDAAILFSTCELTWCTAHLRRVSFKRLFIHSLISKLVCAWTKSRCTLRTHWSLPQLGGSRRTGDTSGACFIHIRITTKLVFSWLKSFCGGYTSISSGGKTPSSKCRSRNYSNARANSCTDSCIIWSTRRLIRSW